MVYIAEVNRAIKVKSDAQVNMNKYSDPVQNFFLRDSWGGQCLQLIFFRTFGMYETSQARKLIFGLQVNIDKKRITR